MESTIDCAKFKNRDGVSCYRNSILAILQSLPIFSDYIIDIDNFKKFYNSLDEGSDVRETLTYQLFKLFNLSLDNPDANLTPSSLNKVMIAKNPVWGEREQQDSSEYLLDMIDKLKSEQGKLVEFIGGRDFTSMEVPDEGFDKLNLLKKLVNLQKKQELCGERYKFLTNMYSQFNNMFNFMTKNTKTCHKCLFENNTFETNSILKLDLPKNGMTEKLENLIKNYSKIEELDEENKCTCPSCNEKITTSVKNEILELPKILMINLKRFEINPFGFSGMKKPNLIIYPLALDLTETINNGEKYEYQLVAVNFHHGMTINHGHYVSIVKSPSSNKWNLFNDESKVIEAKNISMIVNKNASILFYLRKD